MLRYRAADVNFFWTGLQTENWQTQTISKMKHSTMEAEVKSQEKNMWIASLLEEKNLHPCLNDTPTTAQERNEGTYKHKGGHRWGMEATAPVGWEELLGAFFSANPALVRWKKNAHGGRGLHGGTNNQVTAAPPQRKTLKTTSSPKEHSRGKIMVDMNYPPPRFFGIPAVLQRAQRRPGRGGGMTISKDVWSRKWHIESKWGAKPIENTRVFIAITK